MQTPSFATLALALFASSAVWLNAQAAAPAPSAAPAAAAAPAAPATASSLLQPSLDALVSTLNSIKIDKWKKGSVREEAQQNANEILRDVQTNLPPLMAAADAAPNSLSAAMPLVKHLDALYDVLLRVEEASRVAAPSDQISALQQTMTAFGTARFAFDDALQNRAGMQEKQLSALRVAVAREAEARPAETKAAEKPCVEPAKPVHRRKRRAAEEAKKPATTKQAADSKTQTPQKPQ